MAMFNSYVKLPEGNVGKTTVTETHTVTPRKNVPTHWQVFRYFSWFTTWVTSCWPCIQHFDERIAQRPWSWATCCSVANTLMDTPLRLRGWTTLRSQCHDFWPPSWTTLFRIDSYECNWCSKSLAFSSTSTLGRLRRTCIIVALALLIFVANVSLKDMAFFRSLIMKIFELYPNFPILALSWHRTATWTEISNIVLGKLPQHIDRWVGSSSTTVSSLLRL